MPAVVVVDDGKREGRKVGLTTGARFSGAVEGEGSLPVSLRRSNARTTGMIEPSNAEFQDVWTLRNFLGMVEPAARTWWDLEVADSGAVEGLKGIEVTVTVAASDMFEMIDDRGVFDDKVAR